MGRNIAWFAKARRQRLEGGYSWEERDSPGLHLSLRGGSTGIWTVLLALLGGVSNPFQSGTNAQLNKQLTQSLWATICVYALGLLVLLGIQIVVRQPVPLDKVSAVSWWAWLGAPISLVSTFIALSIAQKMGSGIFTGVTVTASLVTSVVLDHFGLIGYKVHPASPLRIAGCVVMIVGLWLMAKF